MFDHSKFDDLLLANSKKSFLISEYRAVDTAVQRLHDTLGGLYCRALYFS